METTAVCRRVVASPLGELTVEASERGLRAIYWGRQAGPAAGSPAARRVAGAAVLQLREYFAGRRRRFALKLDLEGTPFQQAVWQALLRIPYGQTASYADVARRIGHPKACRAVGGANRRNPVPIVVPCHRVIGSSGELVGYAGRSGLPLKRLLLDLEAQRQLGA